ncbi:transcriptional regulator [Staphylococcus pseudintermedius]|nr:transcriptional regulator [Staphylococcus pseudintermedius]EJM2435064.1 transcriptional regulator [Staphylococcus pseudintermedius]MDK3672651.1 transcriptional regulator [Staphylococcus pseudintermedius]
MTEIKPGTFRYIESEIYNLEQTKEDIKRLRLEILNPMQSADENIVYGPLRSGEPARTTEIMATRLMTNKMLRNQEEMVQAIERTYSKLPVEHKKVIQLKYWSSNHLKMEHIADECHMHRNTAGKIRKNFVKAVALEVGMK